MNRSEAVREWIRLLVTTAVIAAAGLAVLWGPVPPGRTNYRHEKASEMNTKLSMDTARYGLFGYLSLEHVTFTSPIDSSQPFLHPPPPPFAVWSTPGLVATVGDTLAFVGWLAVRARATARRIRDDAVANAE